MARTLLTSVTYLEDSAAVYEGLKIYGMPWQFGLPRWAFNFDTDDQLKVKCDPIPEDTNILVCHMPTFGILDESFDGEKIGSKSLLAAIEKIRPQLVVFGHIHESYGSLTIGDTTYVNASTCDFNYNPVNRPMVVELIV